MTAATTSPKAAAPSPSTAAPSASQAAGIADADLGISGADIISAMEELHPTTQDAEASPEAEADTPSTAGEAHSDSPDAADDDADSPAEGDPAVADEPDANEAQPDAEADEAAEEETAPEAPEEKAAPDPKGEEAEKGREAQARIAELTAARREAEEEAARLRERLAAFEARDAGRLEPDVLETITDPAQLAARKKQWSELKTWAARNLNRESAELNGKEFSQEQIAAIFAQTDELLTVAAPRREQYLAERARYDAGTAQVYPWAKHTAKGLGKVLQQSMEQLPELARLPNGRLIAADSLIGATLRNHGIVVDDALLARLAKEAKQPRPATAPTGTPRVPPPRAPAAPSRAGSVPPRVDRRVADQRTALQRLSKSNGSEADVTQFIAANL